MAPVNEREVGGAPARRREGGGAPKSSDMTPLLVCMQSREAKLSLASGFAILVTESCYKVTGLS